MNQEQAYYQPEGPTGDSSASPIRCTTRSLRRYGNLDRTRTGISCLSRPLIGLLHKLTAGEALARGSAYHVRAWRAR